MKKRFFALAIATLALSACGLKSPETTTTAANGGETTAAKADSGSEGAEVTLVYAEVNPLDTIVGQSGTAFKEKVEELSGGKNFSFRSYKLRCKEGFTSFITIHI